MYHNTKGFGRRHWAPNWLLTPSLDSLLLAVREKPSTQSRCGAAHERTLESGLRLPAANMGNLRPLAYRSPAGFALRKLNELVIARGTKKWAFLNFSKLPIAD